MKPEVLKPEAPQPAPRGTVNARLTVLRGTASVNARLTVLLDRPCSVAQLLHILECDGHLRRQIAARLDDFKPTTGVSGPYTTRPQPTDPKPPQPNALHSVSWRSSAWHVGTLADRQAQAVGFRDDVELRQMAQQEEARIASKASGSPGKASKSGQPMRAKRSAGKPASVSAKPAA